MIAQFLSNPSRLLVAVEPLGCRRQESEGSTMFVFSLPLEKWTFLKQSTRSISSLLAAFLCIIASLP